MLLPIYMHVYIRNLNVFPLLLLILKLFVLVLAVDWSDNSNLKEPGDDGSLPQNNPESLSSSEIKAFSDFAEKHFIEVHTRNVGVVYRSGVLYEQNRLQAPHTFDEVDFERVSQPTRGICLEQSPMLNSLGRLDMRVAGDVTHGVFYQRPCGTEEIYCEAEVMNCGVSEGYANRCPRAATRR